MKYVRETAAGKSVSAWVIMKGAYHIATVQAHYSNGGRVTLNVWQMGEAQLRSYAAKVYGKPTAALVEGERRKAYDVMSLQGAHAGGGGYDKFTAALSGLWIDGHRMSDHASPKGAPKPPRGRKTYPSDMKLPKGYRLANYVSGEDESGYQSCYRLEGLKYLEALGYTVIQAL